MSDLAIKLPIGQGVRWPASPCESSQTKRCTGQRPSRLLTYLDWFSSYPPSYQTPKKASPPSYNPPKKAPLPAPAPSKSHSPAPKPAPAPYSLTTRSSRRSATPSVCPTRSPPLGSYAAINEAIAYLRGLNATATSFYSSYLHYGPPATVTQTVPSTRQVTTTLPNVLRTTTVPITQVNTITSITNDIPDDPTITIIATVMAPTPTIKLKRGPAQQGNFSSSCISSAYRCIVTRNTRPVTQTVT